MSTSIITPSLEFPSLVTHWRSVLVVHGSNPTEGKKFIFCFWVVISWLCIIHNYAKLSFYEILAKFCLKIFKNCGIMIRYKCMWRAAPKSWSENTTYNNQLVTYFLPVCYLLRILQYPVNTTYNSGSYYYCIRGPN